MNLQHLEYLKKIEETGNFTKAAEECSVTQPALSKAISKLEEELNAPLFKRNGRSIELTDFGKVFLKHSNIALIELNKGINEVRKMLLPNKSIISIASTHCIGSYFIPYLIGDFLNNNKDIRFEFSHESTNKILDDLKYGKISLGFYDDSSYVNKYREIHSEIISKEEYVLIVPKNHRLAKETEVSLKNLKNESFIVQNDSNKDSLISYSEFMKHTTEISLEHNEVSMIGGLVATGAGIAIIPKVPLINTIAVSVIKIKEEPIYKTIYIGWLKDSYMSPTTKKFIEHIIKNHSM
ncbi:LysR family transcriptional regulator [Clostridium felsineum]|uniref:LysR family transcriptional regulator n=1 Tax=Clostridium felsineum TaxID=36839 RepID=UPI00214DBD10|nr:LysR family transcriptional regulator [Clostridium felsineum]MCR3757575.1 LysR family transcriptional regulator [Clostridium felsineum]